jgi:hypothetical protein
VEIMKVAIKSLEVDMEIKNKGVELEVYEPNGLDRLGNLVITKTELIWCAGKTRRENGTKLKWPAFVGLISAGAESPTKVAAGRQKKTVTENAGRSAKPVKAAARIPAKPAVKKRTLSPEGRQRIAEAARKRWAAQRKAEAKAAK